MTSSNTAIKANTKRNSASTSDQSTLCRNCKKDASASNQTIATRASTPKPSTSTLTDHTLALFEGVPMDLADVEYRDFLMAKEQYKELNTNWKRVREDEPESLEQWIQNKKSNVGKESAEMHPLSVALQEAGMLLEDSEMVDSPQSTPTDSKKSSAGNYKFRSRSATRASSTGPPTPVSTEVPESATKDVDSLTVGKDKKHRSSSRARSSQSKEPLGVTLSALLDSTDHQPSSESTAPSSQKPTFRRGQLDPEDLQISDTVLGEGQLGTVRLGFYKGLYVACKTKRQFTRNEGFYSQTKREMLYAAKLASCRYINRYIGWILCRRSLLEKTSFYTKHTTSLYIIQRYVPNGDARGYLEKRESSFKPQEVLQASTCLFAALTDAHAMNIGIVDLKLENFLIDSSGAGWLTDFGSCIEFKEGKETVNLDEEKVAWTDHVAPPEMLRNRTFSKASDVFMATLIIAELMTADVSDVDFQNNILQRCPRTGDVSFSSALIDPMFNAFFTLLQMGLHNNPKQRPTAKAILDYLLVMKG